MLECPLCTYSEKWTCLSFKLVGVAFGSNHLISKKSTGMEKKVPLLGHFFRHFLPIKFFTHVNERLLKKWQTFTVTNFFFFFSSASHGKVHFRVKLVQLQNWHQIIVKQVQNASSLILQFFHFFVSNKESLLKKNLPKNLFSQCILTETALYYYND